MSNGLWLLAFTSLAGEAWVGFGYKNRAESLYPTQVANSLVIKVGAGRGANLSQVLKTCKLLIQHSTVSARYSHLSPEHRLSVIDRIATTS